MGNKSGSLEDQENVEEKHTVGNTTATMTSSPSLPRTGWFPRMQDYQYKDQESPRQTRMLVILYGPPS